MSESVDALVSQMTLDEKIDYLGGYKHFNIRPVRRLDIPEIVLVDGPAGCRNYPPSTAYPAAMALAASWNPALGAALGCALGRDCRARGAHVLLAPGVNMMRSPLCGRNFEYMGEDPFLASVMAVALIRSLQAGGVLATVKHYAANNQEYDRNNVSSEIDERTLREIYLPAFRAAVQEGGVACVMNGYNLLNGTHCTEHAWLNQTVLRSEWGFEGVLMSDWDSVYSAEGAANHGLDLEMPYGKFMNRKTLLPLIQEGVVSEAVIDEKVRRILRTIRAAGFLDQPQRDEQIPLYDAVGVRAALDVVRQGTVLLKNEDQALPLERGSVKRIAVIGPQAHPGVVGGGGSSQVQPFRTTSILDGLVAAAGDAVDVLYDSGGILCEPDLLFKTSAFEWTDEKGLPRRGLCGEYFANRDFTGAPVRVQLDRYIDFNWQTNRPCWLPEDGFSVRWHGKVVPARDGTYVFVARHGKGMRVWIDDTLALDGRTQQETRITRGHIELKGGTPCDIRIEYCDEGGTACAQVGWMQVEDPADCSAARLAASCDAAVVCVGFTAQVEREGHDRPFELPRGQDILIQAVARANSRTIVALNSGGSVATEAWIDAVPALLHAWFPGQEGGRALAEILFGDVNPIGKLPMSFERKAADNPAAAHYGAPDGKRTFYKEGIFVGYRGYDAQGVDPLFCFGHGLSYTRFGYADLAVSPAGTAAAACATVDDRARARTAGDPVAIATCTIRNEGERAGAEVVQLYIRDLECSVPRPIRELKGFARVMLEPGASTQATLPLYAADFAFFHPETKTWTVEPGRFEIGVGASSRDIRLTGCLDIGV